MATPPPTPSAEPSALRWDVDVEMEDVFPSAQGGVELDGRVVNQVGLDVDDVGAKVCGDALEQEDEVAGDALAAVSSRYREVVDVDFAAFAFELFEHVGDEASDDSACCLGGEHDEGRFGQEPLQIGIAGWRALVGLRVFEGVGEHRHQLAKADEVLRPELGAGMDHGGSLVRRVNASKEVTHERGNLVEVSFEEPMAAVEQV